MIVQLLTIRKKQVKIFEDLTMFEQRILYHELSSSFNSITISNNEEQCVNQCNKMVQDLKRQMLNTELERYENLYEQELATVRSEIYMTESSYSNQSPQRINAFC
jgi:predicted metal-dependent hydrolase